MSYKFTFKKSERLCSKKEIEILFNSAKSINVYPLKLIWYNVEFNNIIPIKVLITVPKKNIKKAVDRNFIKRRLREAYRKNKTELFEYLIQNNLSCYMAIIYTSRKIEDYQDIETKIILILQRLQKEFISY